MKVVRVSDWYSVFVCSTWLFTTASGESPTELVQRVERCSMLDTQRIECGWFGITPAQCKQKGCCHRDSLTPGVPHCYYRIEDAPAGKVAEVEQCTVSNSEKVDCGFSGITPDSCRSQGCCYMHSLSPGTPFCFHKKGTGSGSAPVDPHLTCSATGFNRVDCGFSGITAATCRAKGCCYVHTAVSGAPFCFYKSAPTTTLDVVRSTSKVAWGSNGGSVQAFLGSGQAGPSNAKRLVADVTGVAVLLLIFMAYFGCCKWSHKACLITTEEDQLLYSRVPQETACTRLSPESDAYQEFHRLFLQKWDTTWWPSVAGLDVPPPAILEIFSISAGGQAASYRDEQHMIDLQPGPKEGKRPGNEKRRFHGARITCDFRGTPCTDPRCWVCRIVEHGSFGNDHITGSGIRFSAGSHTAKGQGLSPGNEPPPANLEHFVGVAAGNAVFVADVLLGRPQIVSSHTSAALPAGMHSRIADQTCGVDEIVIYNDAQALPRALILFT